MRVPASAYRENRGKAVRGCGAACVKLPGRRRIPRTPTSRPGFAASPRARVRSAIVAVAHTILVSGYHRLKNQQSYRELGADFVDRRNAKNVQRYLLKRLERLGLQVTVQSLEDTTALLA